MARVHGSPKMTPVFTARERAVAELFENADSALFSRVIRNDKQVLQLHYLPDRCEVQYNRRPRQHSTQLISKTTELN